MNSDYEWWRTFNAALALVAFILTFAWSYRYWDVITPIRRMRMMALAGLLFAVSYGSFEIVRLDTNFRIPMTTIAVIWSLIAVFLKEEPHGK